MRTFKKKDKKTANMVLKVFYSFFYFEFQDSQTFNRMDKFVAFDLLLTDGCLPLVGSRAIASIRSVATGNGSGSNVGLYDWAWCWDSDL